MPLFSCKSVRKEKEALAQRLSDHLAHREFDQAEELVDLHSTSNEKGEVDSDLVRIFAPNFLLVKAICKGAPKSLCAKLLCKDCNLDECVFFGRTPLTAAVVYNPELVPFLLEQGADAKYCMEMKCRNEKCSALVCAIFEESNASPALLSHTISTLLEHGSDPNTLCFMHHDSIFVRALLSSTAPTGTLGVECMLKSGKVRGVNTCNAHGQLLLNRCIANRVAVKRLELLIELGAANVNACDTRFDTPLHLAIGLHADMAVIELLLANGAKVYERNMLGITPLDLAGQVEREDKARIICLLRNAGLREVFLLLLSQRNRRGNALQRLPPELIRQLLLPMLSPAAVSL